jgi:putative restriction endonuclease
LVASHISRWADDPEARGHLANVICFCVFHDAVFEEGYFSLSDSCAPLKKRQQNATVAAILDLIGSFRMPLSNPPAVEYLRKHRRRVGMEDRAANNILAPAL